MQHNIFAYILVMALVTYAIRALPLTLIRGEIKSPFLKSFIYYVPYVTLSAMTVPAIFFATGSVLTACAGFAVAVLLAFRGKSLLIVAAGACAAVFLAQLILTYVIG